jgi:hypothetical protein
MPMNIEAHQKITTAHLSRLAYLYVRQSTLRQVLENTESTHRQYALRERAIALGWPQDRIVVIDSDLGQSGASAADREGFQRLVTEVSLGRVGIVLGLEVSRLARNSTDWHRLLELCALADTLILDEDGLWEGVLSSGAERGVDPAARHSSWLYYLGRVPVEPPEGEGQRARLERGTAPWTGTRGHGAAAGTGDLWNLR